MLNNFDRQLNLLSFGEEAAELEPPVEQSKKPKMKSSYDFMQNAVPTPAELLEEINKPASDEKANEKKPSMQEKLKEKVQQMEEKKKQADALKKKEAEKEEAKTPVETTTSTIEKLKQDIRNISKVSTEEEVPVQKKEKKKSLVALEREKYAAKQKKNKKKADKEDDSDVNINIIFMHCAHAKEYLNYRYLID